jgi:quercetin dioxygenase-like cupin family protein
VAVEAGDAYWTVGMRIVVVLPSSATDGRLEMTEFDCPPGVATPVHVHSREDETFRVLEGTIRYICGTVAESAASGATIHLPRGVRHAFVTSGDRSARLLHAASPAGMVGFQIATGVAASGPRPNPNKIDRGGRRDRGPVRDRHP